MISNCLIEAIKIKIKDFDKKGYDYCDWKYVSPYCQEWMLYSYKDR